MGQRLDALRQRLLGAMRKHWTYRIDCAALAGGEPFWCVQVPTRGRRMQRVALASGVHGDEPAAIEALLRVLDEQALPAGSRVDFFPCLNPLAYEAGRRDPERAAPGLPALERMLGDRDYDLFVTFEERARAGGFYVIEIEGAGGCLAPAVAARMDALGFPLARAAELARFAAEEPGWGAEPVIERGLILRAPPAASAPDPSLAAHLRRTRAGHVLAFVSPLEAPLELRVQMHLAALSFLFARLREHGSLVAAVGAGAARGR